MLRKEHDALVTEIITRNRAGEVIKSTGDGLLAILHRSLAVERAIEIQERLHDHPFIRVRIGMDTWMPSAGSARLKDGSLNTVRVPDAVLRVEPQGNAGLLQSLNAAANQWDPLFP